MQQIDEAYVATQRVESRVDPKVGNPPGAFFVGLKQIVECLLFQAEAQAHERNVVGGHISAPTPVS